MSQVHPVARTTPHTRAEMRASSESLGVLAERYNIGVATAREGAADDLPPFGT